MERRYVLDENDIKSIIARHFKVSKDKVDLSIAERCVGYGMGERTEKVVEANVTYSKKGEFNE